MADIVQVHVKLMVEGTDVEGAVALPTGPAPRRVLLPVLQRLTDAVVSVAERRVSEEGGRISCAKGCNACCRQMVPISGTEAYGLAAVLEGMEPRRGQRILARFESGLETLDRAGVLDRLLRRAKLSGKELAQLDRDYFAAQVACPFLERGACSIHKDRPPACREFLVTSPARHCANPGGGGVRQVALGAKVSRAVLATEKRPWVPLILARHFVARWPERAGKRGAAAELKRILAEMTNDK